MKMNKSITLNRLLDLIREDGIIVKIENRIPYKDYGFPNNHAEVLNYINDADGDLWDTMIFGYNKQFKYGDHFKTNEISGYLKSPTGNHKLLIKIPYLKYFDEDKHKTDIANYIKQYKKNNNIQLEFIKIS